MKSTWVLFQYLLSHLIVTSRKDWKPWDLYLELYDCSQVWQALWQQCCWCASQVSKCCDNLNYQSHSLETSWDLTIRRLIRYWNEAQYNHTQWNTESVHNFGYVFILHIVLLIHIIKDVFHVNQIYIHKWHFWQTYCYHLNAFRLLCVYLSLPIYIYSSVHIKALLPLVLIYNVMTCKCFCLYPLFCMSLPLANGYLFICPSFIVGTWGSKLRNLGDWVWTTLLDPWMV